MAQLAVAAGAPLDTAQGVNFHALVIPDTVYVGQQVTYQVGVFIDNQLRLRLRRNPEFVPPDPQGMLSYELAVPPREPPPRHVGHHVYEVHVFQRAFFPLAPGRYEVPSAELAYSLPLSLSFFSREESHTMLAESLIVVARPPPLAGRPADFSGAVGELSVATHVDATSARVGDPLRLTLSVAGRGDVNLFPRPTLAVPWASSVVAQERVRLDSTADNVRGEKEFDWLLTPQDSGRLVVPPVRYPYFNPYTERYEIAIAQPEPVHVAAGTLAPTDTAHADAAPPLAIRATLRGAPSPSLYQTPGFVVLAFGAPIPAVLISAWRRPRRKKRPLSAAAALRALARGQGPSDAALARRLLVRALRDRFVLDPTAFTDPGTLTHALRREGVTASAAAAAERVLVALDQAAFGATAVAPQPLVANAYAALINVAAEARRPASDAADVEPATNGRRRTLALLIVAGLAASGGWAGAIEQAAASVAARDFATGVAAYQAGAFGRAAVYFGAVAQWAPRASNAWANAGTAAWAAGDSADAVVGWQHAGRLEPLATDVRERLALVRAAQDGPIARIPRFPTPLAANIALGCWLAACVVAAWNVGRGRRAWSTVAVLCGVVAVGAAWGAVRVNESAAARHLAVVGSGTALYAAPALAAERIARLDAGDVALVVAAQGVWADVRLDGDREGWVESAQLTSLARR